VCRDDAIGLVKECAMPDTTDRPLVLVVDDESAIRDMIARAVEDLIGAQVVTAGDGLEAIALVHRQCPDAILLDLNMPVMDGYGVIDHLRTNSMLLTVPIIVVSGECANDQRRALALGANTCLEKPFEDDDLIRVVRQYLSRRADAPVQMGDLPVEAPARTPSTMTGWAAGTRKRLARSRNLTRRALSTRSLSVKRPLSTKSISLRE
jgi:two-component system, chemotaxis family, chemotaxis protein CheY